MNRSINLYHRSRRKRHSSLVLEIASFDSERTPSIVCIKAVLGVRVSEQAAK